MKSGSKVGIARGCHAPCFYDEGGSSFVQGVVNYTSRWAPYRNPELGLPEEACREARCLFDLFKDSSQTKVDKKYRGMLRRFLGGRMPDAR